MKSYNKSTRIYFCCDWHFKGLEKMCGTIWAYLLEQFELNLVSIDFRILLDSLTVDLLNKSIGPANEIWILTGLFSAISGKAPGLNWEKMVDLTSKLGEFNDIEHNKGSKIYH